MATRPPAMLDQALTHVQPRDRLLIRLLAEHEVLTTPQIHTLLFGSLRICQRRLARLRQLRLLHRFRQRDHDTGRQAPARWTLGPLGIRLQAVEAGEPFPTDRTVQQRLERIAGSTQQAHRLGTNQFFIDLIAHSRHQPATRLVRWWSQQRAETKLPGIIPDGHGIWHTDHTTVAWFLEYDTGSMNLDRLIKKLAAYDKAVREGAPKWPVLLWLHSQRREHNLHQRIGDRQPLRPMATATRHPATPGPAAAVWHPVGQPHRRHRLTLHQLGGKVTDPGCDWRHPHPVA